MIYNLETILKSIHDFMPIQFDSLSKKYYSKLYEIN